MRKIINRKSYDTDTAQVIGEYSVNYPGDFDYMCETLYRKRTGEYFVHGMGNAASRYAEPAGQNRWKPGERIMPYSYDEAREWAERHLDAEDYEAEFGEVPEDEDESVVLSVRITPAAKATLDRLAAQTGRQKGDLVSTAILSL